MLVLLWWRLYIVSLVSSIRIQKMIWRCHLVYIIWIIWWYKFRIDFFNPDAVWKTSIGNRMQPDFNSMVRWIKILVLPEFSSSYPLYVDNSWYSSYQAVLMTQAIRRNRNSITAVEILVSQHHSLWSIDHTNMTKKFILLFEALSLKPEYSFVIPHK